MSLFKNIKDAINSSEKIIIPKKFQVLIVLGYFALVGYAVNESIRERKNAPQDVPVIFALPDSVRQHIYISEVKIAVLDPFDRRPLRVTTRRMFRPITEPFYLKFDDMRYFPAYYIISFKFESQKYQLPEKIFYYVADNLFIAKDTVGVRLKTSKDKPDTVILVGTAIGDTSSLKIEFVNATSEYPQLTGYINVFSIDTALSEAQEKMRNPMKAMEGVAKALKEEKEKRKNVSTTTSNPFLP